MPVKVGWGVWGVSLSTVNASEGGVGSLGCFSEYGECQ